jgi:hypothetical protein
MAEPDDTSKIKFVRGQPRDPERIDVLLDQIRVIWHQHSDMRLLQLLICVIDPEWNRLFNVEDTVLTTRLREYAETGRFPTASP